MRSKSWDRIKDNIFGTWEKAQDEFIGDSPNPKEVRDALIEYGLQNSLNNSDFITVEELFLVIDYLQTTFGRKYDPPESIQTSFLVVVNSMLYHKFSNTVSKGDFKQEPGEKWPVADLSTRTMSSRAYIMPDKTTPITSSETLEEMQEVMKDKVLVLTKQGDLAADVFDTIAAKWLREAKHFDAMVELTADDFLKARGLKPILSGTGRRGGYTEIQREAIQQQIEILNCTWITVQEMEYYEVVNGRRKKSKWRGESKAIVVTSRYGQELTDGNLEIHAWRARPGDVFTKFLFGPGRQTALLSQKALQYDHYRQKWEKRLTRYLAWLWRISSGRTREGVFVKTLIDAVGVEINTTRPHRTRNRLEDALELLLKDGVISGWEYEDIDENITSKRGWWKDWLDLKILISAPVEILEQYKNLNKNAARLN
ncbi:MAG: hypothetical protein AVO34_12760 [Firmicutes bacterium ML8_F2]|jgi:hypothetical protein|nr:MAG: hypothetical protein AVO34_12760 [Firmicutes bacterium ML8_F2]